METPPPAPWWASSPAPAGCVQSRWGRRTLIFIAVVVVVVLFAMMALRNPSLEQQRFTNGSVREPATLTAMASGCTGIITHRPPPPSEVGWAAPDSGLTWEFTPSTGGSFSREAYTGSPVVAKEDGAKFGESKAVSMLYRGWIVIWYQESTPEDQIAKVQAVIQQLPVDSKVIAAPWTSAESPTWRTKHLWWITGWDKAQPCSLFSGAVIEEFRKAVPAASAPGFGVPVTDSGPKAEAPRRS